MSTIQNLRESLDRNWRPVCSVGGGGFSGAEFAPFPSPLPPTSGRDGPALLWGFSVPLFCEWQAVCSGRVIFSLVIPMYDKTLQLIKINEKKKKKKAPSDCSQGLRPGSYPKHCHPFLSVPPPLAGGGCGRLGYFSAGSCF